MSERMFLEGLCIIIGDYRYGERSAHETLAKLEEVILRRLDMSHKQAYELDKTIQLGKSFTRFLRNEEASDE